jgi:hypothetical protein
MTARASSSPTATRDPTTPTPTGTPPHRMALPLVLRPGVLVGGVSRAPGWPTFARGG